MDGVIEHETQLPSHRCCHFDRRQLTAHQRPVVQHFDEGHARLRFVGKLIVDLKSSRSSATTHTDEKEWRGL